MSEQAPAHETPPAEIEELIKTLLSGVPERFDSINYNTFEDGYMVDGGFQVSLGLSRRPSGNTDYHVRKELPLDSQGYSESWDYHWGDREPTTIHGRTHHSRIILSSIHPDDTYERWERVDEIEVTSLVLAYEKAKIEGFVSRQAGVPMREVARFNLSDGLENMSDDARAFLRSIGIEPPTAGKE